MTLHLASTVQLSSGYAMPRFGFGVYEMVGRETYNAVKAALQNGYRLIDTAEWYGNEEETGAAVRDDIKETNTPRNQIFFTTKIQSNSTEKHATQTIARSLQLSGLDYIDLYLIHSPYPNKAARLATWTALEKAVEAGQVRSIGVSNYAQRHLEELLAKPDLRFKPAVNQVDLHPFMRREADVQYCQKQGIHLMAWGPLARGYRFGHPVLKAIAAKYGKSEANILIRWSLQHGYTCIPKSTKEARIKTNADVFDFEIERGDMAQLDKLDEHLVTDWSPQDDRGV